MKIVTLILFLLIFDLQHHVVFTDEKLNENILKKFNASGFNLNLDLNDIYFDVANDALTEYIEEAGKATSLMVKGMKQLIPPESDESKELIKLKKIITEARTSEKIETTVAEVAVKLDEDVYRTQVSLPLDMFAAYTEESFAGKNSSTFDRFHDVYCKEKFPHNPFKALEYINRILVLDCNKITFNHENYAKGLKWFQNFEEKFPPTDFYYQKIKTKIFKIITSVDVEKGNSFLTNLTAATNADEFESAVEEQRNQKLVKAVGQYNVNLSCFIDDLIMSFEYRHKPIQENIQYVLNDMVQSAFYCSLCANVIFDDDQDARTARINSINQILIEAVSFIKNRLQDQLETAWKNGKIREKLQQNLGDYDFSQNFTKAATQAQQCLNNFGDPLYVHQVLIIDSSTKIIYPAICEPETCFVEKNFKDVVDIYVTRFKKGTTLPMIAPDWFLDICPKKLLKTRISERLRYNLEEMWKDIKRYCMPAFKSAYNSIILIEHWNTNPEYCFAVAEASPTMFIHDTKSYDIYHFNETVGLYCYNIQICPFF